MFPDELNDLSPVEEKLIALNACYGFITKYSIQDTGTQSARYPRHVKGHITVFPNNVQELVARVLPHPLLSVLDEIHVSWQGREKPAPSDLTRLLSVRRRAVENALVWLKRHNSLYADIEIDIVEMDSWEAPSHGVPSQVYARLERNEPSAWEKARTGHVVPRTERGLEDEGPVDIREVLATLGEGQDVLGEDPDPDPADGEDGAGEARLDSAAVPIHEISSSGMFALDVGPDVADEEKLRYACDALGRDVPWEQTQGRSWAGSAQVRSEDGLEPYILVSRGDEYADSFDARFFAKTFPTLFPFGAGGPRQAEECMEDAARREEVAAEEGAAEAEATAQSLVSSRNMSLETWAQLVLQRHGGRFAAHHVFAFFVFNMGVRSRNRRVSMVSVKRKNFPEVERIVRSLSAERLERAKMDLEALGKTTDEEVNQLLRSLSLYGFRQPMSRELRLNMRRKIKSLIIRYGIPAIWFTINPNDITNPVKLRLAAYRFREPEDAEAFLTSLDLAYKRMRLAISDPLSSVLFFHREISMFFKHYVKVGQDSVFGRVSQYFGAVETNERGALHLHGLLWLQGNMDLSSILGGVEGEGQAAYRDQIIQYVDSVFTEDLDQEASSVLQAERSVTSDISSLLQDSERLAANFDEEANFCAGATQIHTHSPTCVKYSIRGQGKNRDPCRFKAPWKLVEKTSFMDDGVLQIRRNHSMVNRWNKAMAIGLRHNHDISFIGTQRKTMAIVFYVTNYATKVEDPVWKRVAAASEVFRALGAGMTENRADTVDGACEVDGRQNRTRQFLMRVANRIFTERPLSQVEVVAHLLGYRTEFTNNKAWTFLNVGSLYWHIFRRWGHLRRAGGMEGQDGPVDETVLLEETGQRISLVEAYPHRGRLLRGLSLYDYMSLIKLKRKGNGTGAWCEVQFDSAWPPSQAWVQALRKPGEHAIVCLDGYLSMDFDEEDELYHRRQKQTLPRRVSFLVDNIRLLRRSAEDAKRDAKQWAALSGEADPTVDLTESGTADGHDGLRTVFRPDSIGNAMRLIDATTGSKEISAMVRLLCRFQLAALSSTEELRARVVVERAVRTVGIPEGPLSGAEIPGQEQVRSIRSQQISVSREREKMIQGIQEQPDHARNATTHGAAVYSVLNGFGEQDVHVTDADSESMAWSTVPSVGLRLGPSTSFCEAGRQLAEQFSLNQRQSIALRLICRQLDRARRDESGTSQLCQFVGGEGGTGKSRIIEAIVELFASKSMSHRLLVTATSGTAAARINGITIHSACNFSKDVSRTGYRKDIDGITSSNLADVYVDGETRMRWREKYLLIIDEFRPVQERSILLPSTAFPWDEEKTFRAEQRHQHDRAHALWNKFTTVVILKEQVRAAGDPRLQRLLTRIRKGIQDQTDLDLLNSTCYQEGRRIPWESGITVVTSLNRNRWNLNMEATLSFQRQHQALLRIFISEHKWKDGEPAEEEALMTLNQGDDSAIPVPGIFMFVPGMPVVVNQNTHQGLKLVNGAAYIALDVILDKTHPGHRIDENTILHFGPPAGILLEGESTRDLHFVGMPPGTILLTPISTKIECQRKRPWQLHDVSRKGLPCTAAFACTDYKVQGRTLERVALELLGTRTMNIDGRAVPSPCDPYSLYVQLSRCPSLDGIMLMSKVRERDFVGNKVPESMVAAEERLESLSNATVEEAESWHWRDG
ncbi:hypothetical protein DM02DRAFT_647465 [Periconia macrospinosa]|uniref:ATP-dependent DNA helicase n=1 Tax=Periconia macrospinosa TaxID=97972 RepID=A0A2V1CZ06_9PLEO|nr:hypothetical protein DM02DRAFT_647465 [Periconia macrospinosa]